jgi:hypothetical protein
VDEDLSLPREVTVQTDLPILTACGRLASLLEERPPIEERMRVSSERQLVGHVDGAAVHLSVWNENVRSHRKSWNVEFDGRFESGPAGAVLKGVIDIPDRTQLRIILWMFRIATVFVAILAVGLAVRDVSQGKPLILWPPIAAIFFVPLVVLGTTWMERDGVRRAADDARLMAVALGRLLLG